MNVFVFVGLSLSVAAFGQGLLLAPPEIVVRRTTEPASIAITLDGVPVAAENVGRVRFLVDTHDYERMFAVERGDGVLTLRPTEFIEIGRYELVVDTEHGVARGLVRVTLSDDPMLLENRARELGVSVDEMKRRLGLAEPAAREGLRIEIAPEYVVGQALEVSLRPAETREYLWIVNGQVAKSGVGPHTFRYVLKQAGAYTVRYQERHGGRLVADVPMQTTVEDEPALPWTVPVHGKTFVPGPEGFDAYEWRVNGEVASTLPTLRYVFSSQGAYTVECVATSAAPVEKYRKITYAVSVE